MVTINLIMLKFKAFAALLSLYVGIYIHIARPSRDEYEYVQSLLHQTSDNIM